MRIIFGFILFILVGFVVYYSLPITTERGYNTPPVVDMSDSFEVPAKNYGYFDDKEKTYYR